MNVRMKFPIRTTAPLPTTKAQDPNNPDKMSNTQQSDSDEEVKFFDRNDLLIFVDNKVFFGFRTSRDVTWGNLCACMQIIVVLEYGTEYFFRPRGFPSTELIHFDHRSRAEFGNYKEYDFIFKDLKKRLRVVKRQQIPFKKFKSRPRATGNSKANTPSVTLTRTPSLSPSPFLAPSGSHSGASTPIDTEPESHSSRAGRRASQVPSPVQNQGRASKAPDRCWEMYKQCCITGTGLVQGCDSSKPPDIVSTHIFPYAYQKDWLELILSDPCEDKGPNDDCDHDYTGYHQICCLNNMIPLRSDVHNLWDAYLIGVDIYDGYRVISFNAGCKNFAQLHLNVNLVESKYQPHDELLTDHLMQGVWRFCLFPGWKDDGQQSPSDLSDLDSLVEDTEGLDLDSEGGLDEVTRAYAQQIGQFNMKEREYGLGKAAFEDYLHAALSIQNDTVSIVR